MHPKLQHAIQLRTDDQLEEARTVFQELYAEMPDDPLVNYHFAWLHDKLGEEREAVPYYEKALALGLPDEELRGAMLGLGSTYRCIGEYTKAVALLEKAVALFPNAGEFNVFLAMALYNLGRHHSAMTHLLNHIANASQDAGVQKYERAIRFYAERLDEIW